MNSVVSIFFAKLYLFIEPLLGASQCFMYFMCSKSFYLQKKTTLCYSYSYDFI